MNLKYLIVEITESVMKDFGQTESIIQSLHDHNIQIAIDDFGTEYSSLSILNNMEIDMVKIDRTFNQDIPKDDKTVSLVKTMIQMGENLDFVIVAEGGTVGQSDFLINNDYGIGQGYYFSRTISADEVVEYVQDEHRRRI